MSKQLIYVTFFGDVNIGGHQTLIYSTRMGETNEAMSKTKMTLLDNGDIEMIWSGDPKGPQTDIIPRHNIRQYRAMPSLVSPHNGKKP